MLYFYYLKKVVLNKLIIFILTAVLIVNFIIIPVINTNLFFIFQNYKNTIDIFILINLAIGIIFGGLISIVLCREPLDSGIELWMASLPYSRVQFFLNKFLVFLTSIFVYSFIIPLLFLGMIFSSYTGDIQTYNSFFGLEQSSQNFGKSFGILFGAYLFYILFFSSFYLIASLFLKQIFIIIIIFTSTIGFATLSLVPAIGAKGITTLQHTNASSKIFEPNSMSKNTYDLINEVARNSTINNLDKTQEYLEILKNEGKILDDLMFAENAFSKIAIKQEKENKQNLTLVNPFTYFETLTDDIYDDTLSSFARSLSFNNSKSKKLVKKETDLSNANNFKEKEAILAKRFANLQETLNITLQTLDDFKSLLTGIANPSNDDEIQQYLKFSEEFSKDPFSKFSSYDQWKNNYLVQIPSLPKNEASLELIKNEKNEVLTLNSSVEEVYLKILGIIKVNPNLIFDTEYVDVFPAWGVYLILLPLILLGSSLAFYASTKIRIK